MNKYSYIGKTKEEAIKMACDELNISENEMIISEKETKQGLFSKKIEIEVLKRSDIVEEIKNFLINITEQMGIEVQIGIKIRENTINMKMYSEHNNILIGKNGQTLASLQLIIKQMLQNKYNTKMNILLDVENYKEKQLKNLEYLAKKTAKEVATTKIEAKLEPMNSYQRRIVHSALTNFKGIYTESVGAEPNRAIVIKPKED